MSKVSSEAKLVKAESATVGVPSERTHEIPRKPAKHGSGKPEKHGITASLAAGFSPECELFLNRGYDKLNQSTFIQLASEFDRQVSKKGNLPPRYYLAQCCKAHPRFAHMTGEEVADEIWDETDYDDGEEKEEFIGYFYEALYAPGENLLTWACRMAAWFRLRKSKRPLYDGFVSLTAWMQKGAGKDDFFYAEEQVAERLGCSQPAVSKMTKSAIRDGYLRKTKEAVPHVRAAEYRFNLARVDFPPPGARPELDCAGKHNPAYRQLADYFCAKYQEHFGCRYIFQNAKDGLPLVRMVQDANGDLRLLRELIDRFFASDDNFIMETDYSLVVFESQIHKLMRQNE